MARVNADKPHLWKADIDAAARWYDDHFRPTAGESHGLPANVGSIRTRPEVREQRLVTYLADILDATGYRETTSPGRADSARGTYELADSRVVGANRRYDVVVHSTISPDSGRVVIRAVLGLTAEHANRRRAGLVRSLRSAVTPPNVGVLFLCGRFDAGFLGVVAAEGFDWVWAHRVLC